MAENKKNSSTTAEATDTKAIVSKDDIAREIAKKYSLSIQQSKEIVTDIFNTVIIKSAENAKVSIYGFGTFEAVDKPEKEGINPRTKEKIIIAARRSVKFSPSKAFKDNLNGKA